MRILFLSNFYPPASRGGYEQWCQEVLDGLRSRGHDVIVLTSNFGKNTLSNPDPAWVQRSLHLEMELASLKNAFQFFTHRRKREQENLDRVRDVLEQFRPDAVLVWGMWNLHYSIPLLIEKLLPNRVAYYMGDYWPTLPNPFEDYWNAPARNPVTGLPKLLLKPFAKGILTREGRAQPALEHVLFPTAFMQTEFESKGIKPRVAKVIYGAIDTSPYARLSHTPVQSRELSLLYIGRLSEEKGVHTAIEALGCLKREGTRQLKLTIVGQGEPPYEARLRQLARSEHVESLVEFLPAQPKEKLPAFYQQADVFLFTSIWPEPFGRVIVEAMASGVAVIGAATGGAGEIMSDHENALLFTPGDPADLADKLKKLIENSALREKLGKAGRETALTKFDIQRMTTGIEDYLQTLASK
jgi:glycosyltransferase involved in cell wall biosynthesis